MTTSTEVLSRQQRRFRARKGVRTPGLEPVHNAKVTGMYQAFRLALLKEGATPVDSHNRAMAQLRSALPAARLGMKRGWIKPSKSDNPAYRKPYILKAFRPHSPLRAVDLAKAA